MDMIMLVHAIHDSWSSMLLCQPYVMSMWSWMLLQILLLPI